MSLCIPHGRRLARQLQLHLRIMQKCYASSGSSGVQTAPLQPVEILTSTDYPVLIAPEHRQRCLDQLRQIPAFPRPKSQTVNKQETKSASVLIALCQERDCHELSLLYTRRSRHLRSHSYQISFPGGKRDEQDASFVECALRETEEEIGLPRERVQVWGEGNSIHLPRAASIVPVVGMVPDFHISDLKLNGDEVEEAFSIPLNALMSPQAARHTQFRGGYSGPVFVVDQQRIWGITGYLTHVFLRCLLPKHMLPDCLKTNIRYVRPYKMPPKLKHQQHHHPDHEEQQK